ADDDGAKRDTDIRIGSATRISGNRNDATDKGKTGTEVTGHTPGDEKEENQGADTRHQHSQIGIKAHQQRGQYRGAKHGHNVLSTHHRRLRPGKTLVWCYNLMLTSPLNPPPDRK